MKIKREFNEMEKIAFTIAMMNIFSKRKLKTDEVGKIFRVGKTFVKECKTQITPEMIEEILASVNLEMFTQIVEDYNVYNETHNTKRTDLDKAKEIAEKYGLTLVDTDTGEEIRTHKRMKNPTLFDKVK